MGLSRHFFNFFSNRLRYMATVGRTINHYDALGINPKATQNEIKAAYYKLSMVYHPDKNKDEASLQKFRAITEAYEVLGNVKTRKMYDRGYDLIIWYRINAELAKPKMENDNKRLIYKAKDEE